MSSRWISLLAATLWAIAAVVWLDRFTGLADEPYRSWLVDWHVYAAGAQGFVAGDLYREPLVSAYPLPVDRFNYPPAAAIWPIPFLGLPDAIGGTLWVLLNIAAAAVATVLTTRIVGARPVWFWSGAAFLAYSLVAWGMTALIGNNSPLILLMIAGFVAAHLAKRSALAGALLGIAIATKLWPATFLVVLARERRWQTFAWAVGVAAAITAAGVLWLGGLAVLRPMARSLTIDVEVERQVVVGITWLRENIEWWPEWGGYALSLLILLIPARGLTGYGLATLAGMVAIPNLWRHYWGTVIFGVVLVGRGLLDRRRAGATKPPHARPMGAAGRFGEAERDPEFGS
jgi:hypothetical protein